MAIRIKGISILDTSAATPINRLTDVLGMSVGALNVRVEIEAGSEAAPAKIALEIRMFEPTLRRAGKASVASVLPAAAQRVAATRFYLARVALSSIAELMKNQDDQLEVATVVRDGGTSAKLFRSKLAGGGWALRGAARQAAEGRADVTGSISDEQPDAKALFLAGGVELLEVGVAAAPGLKTGPQAKTWAFMRSPADVFFYSGHGGWWNCNLLREDHASGASTGYPLWLSPETLLSSWKKQKDIGNSPMDLDVLIINGCSVLGDFGPSTEGESVNGPANKPSCALRWQDLLTSRQGPLLSILSYRDTAPMDSSGGDQVAVELAQAMLGTLRGDWPGYARKWLEINAKYPQTRTAAALDNAGYWYINKKMAPGSHTHDARPLPGYDPKRPEGAIMGPGAIPRDD